MEDLFYEPLKKLLQHKLIQLKKQKKNIDKPDKLPIDIVKLCNKINVKKR